MKMTPDQKQFIEDTAPECIINGEFSGDDNDFACMVSRFARALANQGLPEAAAAITLSLSSEGFAHGAFGQFVKFFTKAS